MQKRRMETDLAKLGLRWEEQYGAMSTPLYLSAVYRHPALGESTGFDYARIGNPTRQILEQEVARLEGGSHAFATSSGMAAITLILSLFSHGDHLLVSMDLYGGTYRLLEQVMRRFGITATYVDSRSLEDIQAAKRKETRAIFIETPTNPLMQVCDLASLCQWARQEGLLSIIDNTLMTPYYQRPLNLGADIVVHSATKYMGGHNDLLAGLIVVRDEELAERLALLHGSIGAVLDPFSSWLLIRGLKTLAVRLDRQSQNAMQLATYLSQHPLVEEVYYTGLPHHPGREIHLQQASGHGALFSFRVKEGRMVEPILRSLKVIAFAESLGGTDTLMTFPAQQTHLDIPEEIRRKLGVDERLLRLAVGIEHIDDLLEDLEQVLDKAL